jgi:inorganic pyrophosphatase
LDEPTFPVIVSCRAVGIEWSMKEKAATIKLLCVAASIIRKNAIRDIADVP